MNAASSVHALTSALVHQSATASPLLRDRHADFIAKRLGIAFLPLGVAPIFLAFNGAPSALETLVFACTFSPLAAALVLARTGRLAVAHAIACLGLVGLSFSLYGLGCGTGVVATWLSAAALEAALSGSRRIAWGGAALLGATAVGGGVAASMLHMEPAAMPAASAALLAGLGLAYAIVIAPRSTTAAETSSTPIASVERDLETAAIKLIDDVVVGFDASGSVVRICANDTGRMGRAASHLIGRGLFEHVHVADRPGFLKLIADAAHGEAVAPTRLRLRLPAETNGSPSRPKHVWIEMRAAPLAPGANVAADTTSTDPIPTAPCTVVAVLRDADVVRAQEAEVAVAQTTLGEAIRSKDDFLASMSHELRTPLNAIIGFSEMLASYTLRPSDLAKQREYARVVHQSGLHLLSVVNAILDMSKIRSGTFEIVPEAFDVVPLLDLACDTIAPKAQEGRVELVRDYPGELEAIVGDKRACKQILVNLLSNAVKFTPELGTVTLSARPEGTSLAIIVSDTGIGIGAEDLARLGDPFVQARSAHNRPFEGTGLGLSVVRGLVGLHGGTIRLESEPGRGTRVRVHLPLDCRVRDRSGRSATIETLARHPNFEPDTGRIDRRMKQIA